MKTHPAVKRYLSILLMVVMLMAAVPAQAYSDVSDPVPQVQTWMNNWNARSASQRTSSYSGAWQCAAFTRYVFNNIYGHTDGLSNSANNVKYIYGSTAAQLQSAIQNNAVPGDAVRVELVKHPADSHIFILTGSNSGGISRYESNFNSKNNNLAHYVSYISYADIMRNDLGYGRKTAGKYTYYISSTATVTVSDTFVVKVIHASNNKYSVCDHTYNSVGVCTKCGASFPLNTTALANLPMRVTSVNGTSGNAPSHSAPYGDASIGTRYSSGNLVYVKAKAYNAYGNLWYQLTDGSWLVGSYLSNTAVPVATTAKSIVRNNAVVYGSVSYTARPSQVGLYLGTSTGNMKKVATDNINHNKNPFTVWYNIKNEAKITLSANTTYYYCIYAIVNGSEVRSNVVSFKTAR